MLNKVDLTLYFEKIKPLEVWFPYLLSTLVLVNIYLMGNKTLLGSISGIIIQIPWIYYMIRIKQYGLIICAVALLFIQIRNLMLWM